MSLPKSSSGSDSDGHHESHILAISTEDGKVIFFSTSIEDVGLVNEDSQNKAIPTAPALGQLGGKDVGVSGRIKDFIILDPPTNTNRADPEYGLTVVTGSSDGTIRLWQIKTSELLGTIRQKANGLARQKHQPVSSKDQVTTQDKLPMKQIGRLLGTYETGNRITCLTAFVLVSNEDEDGGKDVQVQENSGTDEEENENDGESESD